jgi:hypothetical protein
MQTLDMLLPCPTPSDVMPVTILSKAYKILDGKTEGKRPLGRPRRRWEENIKTYLR